MQYNCVRHLFQCLQELNFQVPTEMFLNSGKFEKLTVLLSSLKEEGHRVLIFSQFILMLDILEVYCEIKGHNFLRLDGSTQTGERYLCPDVSLHLNRWNYE